MKTGKAFWRTLDELADDPSFVERLHNEFPSEVEAITDPTTRRTFMKLMGASLALAGVTACTTQPEEAIVPYVRQPEGLVPGTPMYYATAMTLGGVATGLLVESHEGRPTKIEGNPLHPSSLGAADVFAQASILNIYDPDRAKSLTNLGDVSSWPEFILAMKAALAAQQPLQGAGIRVLSETMGSPSLGAQIKEFAGPLPAAHAGTSGSPRAATMRASAPGSRSASSWTRSTASTRQTSFFRSTPTSSRPVRAVSRTPGSSRRGVVPKKPSG